MAPISIGANSRAPDRVAPECMAHTHTRIRAHARARRHGGPAFSSYRARSSVARLVFFFLARRTYGADGRRSYVSGAGFTFRAGRDDGFSGDCGLSSDDLVGFWQGGYWLPG